MGYGFEEVEVAQKCKLATDLFDKGWSCDMNPIIESEASYGEKPTSAIHDITGPCEQT